MEDTIVDESSEGAVSAFEELGEDEHPRETVVVFGGSMVGEHLQDTAFAFEGIC